MITAVFGGFLLLMLIGVPVAFSIAFVSIGAFGWLSMPLSILPQRIFGTLDAFVLLAIPLFILAGELMNSGGITKRLIHLAQTLVGHKRGGIGMVAVLSEYLVSGVSGSAVADTAAVGSVMIPAMEKHGYTRRKAVGVICGACAMGILVPPSIGMVVYGGLANVSIGALFLAGFIPAAICAMAMMFHLYVEAKKLDLPILPKASKKEVALAFVDSLWALMVPVIIFAGIIGGVFTATEAAVVAVVYALVIDRIVFRELTFTTLKKAFQDTVIMTGTAGLLIALSALLAYVLTLEQVPQQLAQYALDFNLGRTGLVAAIFVLFLLLGMVMDGLAAMIMIVPLLIPFFGQFGIDPIHVGIVIVGAVGIGLFTPPVGAGLVVACSIGRVSPEEATREMLPYLGTVTAALILMIIFPQLVTSLPRLLGF